MTDIYAFLVKQYLFDFTCMLMIWPKLALIVNENRFSSLAPSTDASQNCGVA